MKVTVRDFEFFKSLDVNELVAYLQKHGWQEHHRIYNNQGAIWVKKNDAGELFEIGLPLTREFADYPARMGDAVKTLELTENRSQLEILSELITCLENAEVQGFIVKVDRPSVENIARVTMMGFVVGKLRKITLELTGNNLNLAVKAYQERIPVTCSGDFVKEGGYFVATNLREFGLMLES